MSLSQDPLALAIDLALENVQEHGGRPFGAVLVHDGEIVATGICRDAGHPQRRPRTP
ncbi:hypothetical protein RM532_12120 [Salinisphaera sp. W335]|uniref:Cytidine and deoxycytidylate deaminase zinc-binding region n=1 Tax=Spectribacter hydrogenoxidans TaxID=3075608 RepID=A0ABU3C2B7_9GAMM|nr:hypothetical protein [Salinisphaera sp. W335]MDT0635695.1 hypothetical protein [Salinisphaera sp. W335]